MKCNQCDNQFEQKRKNSLWCSVSCRDTWNTVKKAKKNIMV